MRIDQLRSHLRTLGAKPCHEQRLLRAWLHAQPLDTYQRRADRLPPRPVRDQLPAIAGDLDAIGHLHSRHPAADGATRLLVRLADGQLVESVLLPRAGLCVSTQVGCAVGCSFCMTGRDGLQRQLSSAEILLQVALARSLQRVDKVVFMGMGEPAHNLDNVLEAIDILGSAGRIGHKELVFSTVGDLRVFERLPGMRVRPALALSLHSTDPELRARLLPRAPHIDPAELVELAERYARVSGHPIQYQWTLLDGVNDTEAEIDGIARLLAGRYAMMNLIPYNQTGNSAFRRPAWEHAEAMARALIRRGILTKLRYSAGQEIDGGCGQLRARARTGERPLHDNPASHPAK